MFWCIYLWPSWLGKLLYFQNLNKSGGIPLLSRGPSPVFGDFKWNQATLVSWKHSWTTPGIPLLHIPPFKEWPKRRERSRGTNLPRSLILEFIGKRFILWWFPNPKLPMGMIFESFIYQDALRNAGSPKKSSWKWFVPCIVGYPKFQEYQFNITNSTRTAPTK